MINDNKLQNHQKIDYIPFWFFYHSDCFLDDDHKFPIRIQLDFHDFWVNFRNLEGILYSSPAMIMDASSQSPEELSRCCSICSIWSFPLYMVLIYDCGLEFLPNELLSPRFLIRGTGLRVITFRISSNPSTYRSTFPGYSLRVQLSWWDLLFRHQNKISLYYKNKGKS